MTEDEVLKSCIQNIRYEYDGTPTTSQQKAYWLEQIQVLEGIRTRLQGMALPSEARARHGDLSTSHAAAKSVNMKRSHDQVLFTLRTLSMGSGYQGAFTDEEIWLWYERIMPNHPFLWTDQQSRSSFRSRRAELVRAGLVKNSGTKKRMATGNKAVAWQLTVAGALKVIEQD